MTATPRYDSIADQYEGYVGDGPGLTYALVPQDLTGQRVLDLACGQGRTCRFLAGRGAEVTGVDLSDGLLSIARQREADDPRGITYLTGNAEGLDWWDGTPFDGAVCDMALMDFDDLPGAVRSLAAVLRPGAWVALSLFHPCCPGLGDGPPSWTPEGYFAEQRWTPPTAQGVRGAVGAFHRTLSTYLQALIDAGLLIERVVEPAVGTTPVILLLGCRRA